MWRKEGLESKRKGRRDGGKTEGWRVEMKRRDGGRREEWRVKRGDRKTVTEESGCSNHQQPPSLFEL